MEQNVDLPSEEIDELDFLFTNENVENETEKRKRIAHRFLERITDEYIYRDNLPSNWKSVFMEKFESIQTDDDYHKWKENVIDSLGDHHSYYVRIPCGDHPNNGKIGITFHMSRQKDGLIIESVSPKSPADKAGLKSRDKIVEVNGMLISQIQPTKPRKGKYIYLKIIRPGQEGIKEIRMIKNQKPIINKVIIPNRILTTKKGKRIGYLLFLNFDFQNICDEVKKVLREMTEASQLDGIVIDNRINQGGYKNVEEEILSYFTEGKVCCYVDCHKTKRYCNVKGSDINGTSKIPLVILIGPETASSGETFSLTLRQMGRAYLIGGKTEGRLESLIEFDFYDGSCAWFANEIFKPKRHSRRITSQNKLLPDYNVPTLWEEVSDEKDPSINAALDYFDSD